MPPLLATLAIVSAGCLAGCGASYDREAEAGLVEKQQGEWTPSAGSTEPTAIGGPAAQAADRFVMQAARSAYKIGPLDVLEVSVFKVPELSKSVQVAESGSINLPLVGEVPAADKTAQELERALTKQLDEKYLKNPQVTVYVKEYNSQRATIEGAVKKPGVYAIKGQTTLLQFIAMAESLDKDTASSSVAIFRVINGKRHGARYDIDEIRSGTTPDPIIQQGDVIIVDTSASKVVFNNFVRLLPISSVFVPLLLILWSPVVDI
jgi:polysaccharide export outer membrane protein